MYGEWAPANKTTHDEQCIISVLVGKLFCLFPKDKKKYFYLRGEDWVIADADPLVTLITARTDNHSEMVNLLRGFLSRSRTYRRPHLQSFRPWRPLQPLALCNPNTLQVYAVQVRPFEENEKDVFTKNGEIKCKPYLISADADFAKGEIGNITYV